MRRIDELHMEYPFAGIQFRTRNIRCFSLNDCH